MRPPRPPTWQQLLESKKDHARRVRLCAETPRLRRTVAEELRRIAAEMEAMIERAGGVKRRQ